MKLYATVSSERATKGQGGNDFVRVELQRERGKLSHVLEYTTAGLRLSQITDDGGVILFEQREDAEKGEKQKGEYHKCKKHEERTRECKFYSFQNDPCSEI